MGPFCIRKLLMMKKTEKENPSNMLKLKHGLNHGILIVI